MAVAVMIATHHLTEFIGDNSTLLIARVAIAAMLYIGTALIARSKELEEITGFIFKRKNHR